MIAHRKPEVPFYYWPIWVVLIAGGLIVFYGVFTPGWLIIRFGVWAGEKLSRQRAGGGVTEG
ncbi:MAG: hypothetical protein ACE5EV_03575 [Gaiellales bacterium]